ncbi:MAG: DNA polymerase III subunit alpha [Treponema sp.]|jgi:DNA polymerase-3 subunit alpha|nr:DNA polymerase III subunit alpha [Treponema sp.]
MTGFVHLHVHSDFSLQDASVSVMSLADKAEALGMSHLALTDHGNMFGAMEFIAACRETINSKGQHEKRQNPVKPIIGCEVYVSPGSRFEKKGAESDNKYYHLILLAANREGYLNLIKLCSLAYTEGFYYRPRIDEELLTRYHGGLIALSACASGEIPRLIQAGRLDEAEQKARHYRDLFGDDAEGRANFYLEIQDHGIPSGGLKGTSLSQKDINKAVIDISRKTGIPLVATNDVHYLDSEDYVAHDVLLCIGTGKQRTEERRKKYYGDQFYFKTGDEMAALFSDYPEAIANTVRIAERCVTDVPNIEVTELPQYLPDFEIPPGFDNAGAYLRHLAGEGLAKRYAKEITIGGKEWKEIQERAEYELNTIISMSFTGYFLIVADFINWAKGHGIPVGPGRGSGAGSIVAYALRITDIDPLKYELLFERFLNPDRISMPDFDVDFANEGRDEVIKYVTTQYGKERVGQIITFGTLGAKAVIKDVARTLSISIPESDMITKLIPRDPKITLKKAFEGEPKLRELEKEPKYAELFQLARKLEGLNRHSSLHAAGVVIGKSALSDFVPLYRDPRTEGIATQYDMNHLETCGLVKMDFLGLKTLDVIKHTEELIRRRGGEYAAFTIEHIPETDEATFKMLGEGKSFGIFQFESDGMRDVLKQAKPGKIEDLIALNALYRPGPMDNIPQFIDSKNGRQEIMYPDPSLEHILKETYGVIVYQEQVMQVARIIAGYSMGQADLLRRAMGKKIMEKMVKEKERFIAGATERGYSEKKAGDIFELLIPFAGYGFNKSHAAAYSVLAYQTAYLKANFPAEFTAANLTNEIHSTDKDKLSECIDEARKMGLQIDPPDINHSDKLFSVVDGRIVYGFLGIKGMGDAPADEIVRCREDGPYANFFDFLDRIDFKIVGKSVIERLIQTGAFDHFGITRETLTGNLERVVEHAQKKKEDKQSGQSSLFENSGEAEFPDYTFEEFPEMSRAEKLNIEKQLIGFYFSGHPMDEYKEIWQKAVKIDLGDPENLKTGNCILVGIIKSVKVITTGKGGKMAFATLADYNGEIEITFFSKAWEKCQSNIETDKVAILRGKIEYQKDKDRRSFLAEEWVSRQEVDEAIQEEEAQERRWDKFRNTWAYMADLKSGSLATAEKGSYTVVGFLKGLREFKDKNGNDMAFGTLQDYEGEIDLVFFSRVWDECRDLLKQDEITALKGSIDPESDRNPEKPGFKVSSIADIAMLTRSAARKVAAGEQPPQPKKAAARKTQTAQSDTAALGEKQTGAAAHGGGNSAPAFHIRLQHDAADRDENLYPLRDCLSKNSGPCPVFIHIQISGGEKIVRVAAGINAATESEALTMLKSCDAVAEAWRG